jgi:diaminopimelate decarboxylase
MSDNPRPMMYGSVYEVFDPQRATAPRTANARIVGKHCESGDILVLDAPVPADVKVGDLMVMPVTGAYGYTMASNYNKVPRPAIVFVSNGVARLVTRRETLDDLVRLDV